MSKDLKVDVLISCMHSEDTDIIKKSNLDHDVVVINQTDIEEEQTINFQNNCLWINTPTRGLSKSRNLAISRSYADICVVADDDEVFIDNIQRKIGKVYQQFLQADVVIFKMTNRECKIKGGFHRLGFFDLLRVSSWQISFRKNSIINKKLHFDELMGSGTGNGGGEEIKFLIDCYKKNLKIYFAPIEIASVAEIGKSESQWFNGYNKEFFFQRGYSTRYMLGLPMSMVYAVYYVFAHKKMISGSISTKDAINATFAGIRNNKIARMK